MSPVSPPTSLKKGRGQAMSDLALSSSSLSQADPIGDERVKGPSEERMPPYAGEVPGRRRSFDWAFGFCLLGCIEDIAPIKMS